MPRLGAKRKTLNLEKTQAWRSTPEGDAEYRRVRAVAQAAANDTGMDYGIEFNDLFKTCSARLLPQKHNRYGWETQCEVVMCEILSKCKPGHGSQATRPPSPTGPDFHGGPWIGLEAALAANRAWEADWQAKHGPLNPPPTPAQVAYEASLEPRGGGTRADYLLARSRGAK